MRTQARGNLADKTWTDIAALQRETLGSRSVRIAVLDGPVDTGHACFVGAELEPLNESRALTGSRSSAHGTHVASVIFGRNQVAGIAPGCTGLLAKVFDDAPDGNPRPCSQAHLAHAIDLAVINGANVVTISGGQLLKSTDEPSDALLQRAMDNCERHNVLVIAAAGNDGCACAHLPAAMRNVLVVGALGSDGLPMPNSNWGDPYRDRGILAPGEGIAGASPSKGVSKRSGTSFATPIVAGVAGLLMSLQYARHRRIDPRRVRDALIESARGCEHGNPDGRHCRQLLSGVIDVSAAQVLLTRSNPKEHRMSDPISTSTGPQPEHDRFAQEARQEAPATVDSRDASRDIGVHGIFASAEDDGSAGDRQSQVKPSGICSTCKPQLVYALGELAVEHQTEASRSSFNHLAAGKGIGAYLKANLHEAPSLVWLLKLDGTPIYAISPVGPFAHVTYQRLLDFLCDADIERISVSGYTAGRTVTLQSGEAVPVLAPDIRGMYSWSTRALIESVGDGEDRALKDGVEDFLSRIYFDFRNSGMTPQDRALNYSATNVFQAAGVLKQALQEGRVLEAISVEKSPIARFDDELYDVKMRFFDPENLMRARRACRFTVDVSDVLPIGVGQPRFWNEV